MNAAEGSREPRASGVRALTGDVQDAGFMLPAGDAFARPTFAGLSYPASAAAPNSRGTGACQLGDRSAGDDRMTTRTSVRESLTVPGRPEQAAAARRFTARALGPGNPQAQTAILLVSELVTNSLRHSASAGDGGTITITVITGPGGFVRVEVTDDGAATMPAVRPACPGAEEGRGMQLVSALASAWGCRRAGGNHADGGGAGSGHAGSGHAGSGHAGSGHAGRGHAGRRDNPW